MSLHLGQIFLLQRVLYKIEQMLATAVGTPDILPLAIGERLESLFLAVALGVFKVQPVTDLLILSTQSGQQIRSVQMGGDLGTSHDEQGRHKIFQAHGLLAADPFGKAHAL